MAAILILDDDLNLLGSIARFLRAEGFEVRVSDQPTKVLETLSHWPADLVITDLKMPGHSGLQVLRALRQQAPHLPVLLFSAFGNTPDVVEAIELGAAGYLEKTSAPEALLTKIQATLGDRQVPLKTLPKVGGGEVPLNDRVRAFERSLIEQALKNASGSVKQAMKTLGLSRRTLNEKMQRLGIQRDKPNQPAPRKRPRERPRERIADDSA